MIAEHAAELLDELAVEGGGHGSRSVSLIPQVCGGAQLEVGDRRGWGASPIPRWPLVELRAKSAKHFNEDGCHGFRRGVRPWSLQGLTGRREKLKGGPVFPARVVVVLAVFGAASEWHLREAAANGLQAGCQQGGLMRAAQVMELLPSLARGLEQEHLQRGVQGAAACCVSGSPRLGPRAA